MAKSRSRSKSDGGETGEKRRGNKAAWKVLGNTAAVGSAFLTARALDASWRAATGRKSPTKPESPDLAQREALVWAAFSGAAMGLTRTYATRRAAGYWLKSVGTLPPGFLEENKKDKKKNKKRKGVAALLQHSPRSRTHS